MNEHFIASPVVQQTSNTLNNNNNNNSSKSHSTLLSSLIKDSNTVKDNNFANFIKKSFTNLNKNSTQVKSPIKLNSLRRRINSNQPIADDIAALSSTRKNSFDLDLVHEPEEAGQNSLRNLNQKLPDLSNTSSKNHKTGISLKAKYSSLNKKQINNDSTTNLSSKRKSNAVASSSLDEMKNKCQSVSLFFV